MQGMVEAVHVSASHSLKKPAAAAVRLLPGLGVEGDAHSGTTVQHRSRMARNPDEPNLRQVHLIQAELHEALGREGLTVRAGEMGENITTRGLDLLNLPVGTQLHLGRDAIVQVTGLRNPCAQLEQVQSGLLAAVLDRDAEGKLVRKAGIMGIVLAGGEVRPADAIEVILPREPYQALEPV